MELSEEYLRALHARMAERLREDVSRLGMPRNTTIDFAKAGSLGIIREVKGSHCRSIGVYRVKQLSGVLARHVFCR